MINTDHLFLVYFFYGLSFLVLGILLIALPTRIIVDDVHKMTQPLVDNLWFLGMFAILHGVNEWVDLCLMVEAITASHLFGLISGFLYAMSSLCLFEFAISLLVVNRPRWAWLRWLPPVFFTGWLCVLFVSAMAGLAITETLLSARGWSRYVCGLTGGLLTCAALLSQRHFLVTSADERSVEATRRFRKLLIVGTIFFGINAFLSTVLAAETSLAVIPPHGFEALLGRIGLTVPLAVFRAICAVAISFSIVSALIGIDREQNRVLLAQQNELREANQRLQESIDRLKETQQQLVVSEKMSAVGTLVSGIAHEYNNILSGLKGYTQLARASNDLAQIHQDLETIEEAANRTIEMTRNLLTWVRPERRHTEFVDANDVIRQAIALVGTSFSKRNVLVDVDLQPVVGVPLSKAEVQDIIMNLIINASHAIDEGKEGRILVTTRMCDLESTTVADRSVGQGSIEIVVSDNGVGIAPDVLDKIFLPFFTTKGAHGSGETPGTGLGLYVVYGIVKNAGGEIRVDSTVGRGTRFIITLPAPHQLWQQMAAPENPDVDAEALALLQGMRVLVVDDETMLRDALVRYLTGRTQDVAGAQNGREALHLAATQEFDMILLDLLMPGINGLETLRRLQDLVPETPVVLMTGKPERNIRDQVMSRGAADLIRKPFDFAELCDTVRRVSRMQVRRSIA